MLVRKLFCWYAFIKILYWYENFSVGTLFENYYVGTKTFMLVRFSKIYREFPLAGPPGVWTLSEGQWGAGGGGGGDESEGGEGG